MSAYFEPREYVFTFALGAGPYISPEMGRKFSNGYASVEFYDGEVTITSKNEVVVPDGVGIVMPTAGELTLTATESKDSTNGSYGTIPNGVIDVTVATYDRPNWGGPARFIKATESSAISGNGATHAVVKILRT